MRRRRLLTALASGAGLLAGCGSQSERTHQSTSEATPPADVTTITETKPLPTPADVSSPADARSFVKSHERRYVYNELVRGFGSSQPAVEIVVESPRATVVNTTDQGYYVLSTCRGSAAYFDPDGSPSGATRNTASVAHFVGRETHRRIPFNAYRCAEPVVPAPTESDGDDSVARFQLYDFSRDPDYDHPDQGGHDVNVIVRDDEGGSVLNRTYQTSLPLTVQPRVTRSAERYTLSASLTDGPTIEHDWPLSTSADAAWWALAVVITTDGELFVQTWYPNAAVGLPSSSLCER